MTAFVWDGAGANNWDTDHWGRGGVAPTYPGDAGSAVSDTIVIDGSVNQPASAPAAPLTVAAYTCFGSAFDCGVNLTVTNTLTLGTAAGVDAPVFSGNAAAATTIAFQGGAKNSGTLGDGATFADASYNDSVCGASATFSDASFNTASGTVGEDATFNDDSYNAGACGDGATFNGSSYNGGSATCGNAATFNTDTQQDGEFTGAIYYVEAVTDFAASCAFSGGPPVVFELQNASAKVTGQLSSDGIGALAQVEIRIASQADLAATNIIPGKTILEVAGAAAQVLRVRPD